MSNDPKAIIFDVFGTVVDWRSGVAKVCSDFFARKSIEFPADRFADMWRGEYQPSMTPIRDGHRGYTALDTLHLENLVNALQKAGVAERFSAAELAELNHAWEQLPPWPDSVRGLARLKKRHLIAPCSNGSIALMSRLAKFGNLPWDAVLGAEIARQYKPHPDVYLRSAEAFGVTPAQTMMVAAHNDDLAAARKVGLMTAFIARPKEHGPAQTSDLCPTSGWDYKADSIEELAEMLHC